MYLCVRVNLVHLNGISTILFFIFHKGWKMERQQQRQQQHHNLLNCQPLYRLKYVRHLQDRLVTNVIWPLPQVNKLSNYTHNTKTDIFVFFFVCTGGMTDLGQSARSGWLDGIFGCFRPVFWNLASKANKGIKKLQHNKKKPHRCKAITHALI